MESREHFIKEIGYTPEEFLELLDEIDLRDDESKEKFEMSIDDIDIEYIREGIEREKEEYAWA